MRQFAVRAERGVVGFSPVRALINTGVTAEWPRRARVGLKLVAPDDPACATYEEEREESRTEPVRARGPNRPSYREWVVRSLQEVGQAWLDQVGPCHVDVLDADLLDDGSRLFFATLAALSDERVTIRCPVGPATGPADPVPGVASARELRIEHLAASVGGLTGEESGFLHREAIGYLRSGDGWTAERILRAVLRHRPTPAAWRGLRAACAMLGRPLDIGRRSLRLRPPGGAGPAGRGPLRLHAGWERLERWSETAGQIDRNAVHKALFAIADRTVFRSYETYDDPARPLDFFVQVKAGLVLKIRIRDLDAFEIAHVGSVEASPEIDLGTGQAA
ncbi:DUF6235 family protein [Streptomyces jumonjinensis]|uniref:DUF6235 family protein n=1 Tax=Streptomyces jumonjinensis TaxID=1945 RepID=UPI003790E6A2